MHLIAAFPALLAFLVGIRKGFSRAYLDVYLPAILLLPDYFSTKLVPGLPQLSFNQSAILPCAFLFFLLNRRRWRFSLTDVLVVGYACAITYSEYVNLNYKEAQNLGFVMLTTVVLPYVLTKGIVEPGGNREVFAKRLTLLFAICAVTLLYETRMGFPLIRIPLDRFFPGQGSWVTTFRWGLARAAGPYGHSIVAGMIFVIAFRIARWVQWSGYWRRPVPFLSPRLPFRLDLATFFSLVTAGGVVLTFVRGPWLGALVAAVVVFVCRSKNRGAYLTIALALGVVVGIPSVLSFYEYVSVGRENALTIAQESAAYRFELILEYANVASRRLLWGWGRNGWPQVPGMPSIDNNFLLLVLNHGILPLLFFNLAQLWLALRLLRLGIRRPLHDPVGDLAFTMVGILVAISVSLATVGLLSNVTQIFFMILGWADGLVVTRGAPVAKPVPVFRYERVMS